jgi:ABC-type lipoprotein export system ATPase subunit
MLHYSLNLKSLVLDEHPAGWPLPFHLDLGLSECLVMEGIGSKEAERLAQAAATLAPLAAGELTLWGRDVKDATRADLFDLRRRIALITPQHMLLHRLTLAENLTLGPAFHQGSSEASILEQNAPLLERLELRNHLESFPPQLPDYLVHRALWARELIKEPDLILAVIGDPLSPADQQRLMAPLLKDLVSLQKTAILLMGRSLRAFHPLAHRLLRFKDGRFLEHRFLEHESRPLVGFLSLF